MAIVDDEQRKWRRFEMDNPVQVRVDGQSRRGRLVDVSAGGAGVQAAPGAIDDELASLDIEGIGQYDGWIVREEDDGFAVMFDLDDDLKETLHEELESFRVRGDRGAE